MLKKHCYTTVKCLLKIHVQNIFCRKKELAFNVGGLTLCWYLKNIRPVPLVNKYITVKVNTQKFNSSTSAWTEADSDLKVDVTNQPPA